MCHREKEGILKNFSLYIYIIIIIIIIRPFFSTPHHCWAHRNFTCSLSMHCALFSVTRVSHLLTILMLNITITHIHYRQLACSL